jgi:hypothetical protein
VVAIADAYLKGRVTPLAEVTPVDPALADAVHRAMAPRPEQRFDTVAALRETIETLAPAALAAEPPRLRTTLEEASGRLWSNAPPGAVTVPSQPPPPVATVPSQPPPWSGHHHGDSAFARTHPSEPPPPMSPATERLGAETWMHEPPSSPELRASEPPARTMWSEPPAPVQQPHAPPMHPGPMAHPPAAHAATVAGAPWLGAQLPAQPLAGAQPLPPGAAITLDDGHRPTARRGRRWWIALLALGVLLAAAALAYRPLRKLVTGPRGRPAASAPRR